MRLGHGHLRALGHNAQRRALAQAHAPAHDDAVHERDIRFAVAVDQMVERIFFGEEIFQARVARQRSLMKVANVAARAKRTKCAFFVAATNGHSDHAVVCLPTQQNIGELSHHVQRQSIQCFGAVKGDQP